MALGPQDVALNATELEEVKKLEDKIDNELRNHYNSSERVTKVRIGNVLDQRIVNELVVRYKKAGWTTVTYDNFDELRFTA